MPNTVLMTTAQMATYTVICSAKITGGSVRAFCRLANPPSNVLTTTSAVGQATSRNR
jgi:hypothetical protein